MTLSERYQRDVQEGVVTENVAQAEMVTVLQQLLETLQNRQNASFWRRWLLRTPVPLGWYCWGGVGIGKTYLMDLFYGSFESPRKLRVHFHGFMRWVHQELKHYQGHPSPLEKIADDLVKQYDVLCFDEFMVHDIADAMLLGELFRAFFTRGIVLLATSNSPPDELYRNGLQRVRFLPAIALIKAHCQVLHLHVDTDFRMQTLKESGVYFSPLSEESHDKIKQCFSRLTSFRGAFDREIEIAERPIPTRGISAEVVWFDFKVICGLGRSQQDYLALAESYHTVFISGVTPMAANDNDSVTYFIFLVDILYDAKVKLILEADCPIEALYVSGPHKQAFQRTESRLHEMQSERYLHEQVSV